MIYFIQPEAGGPVKIGYASNLRNRASNIQTGTWIPLVVRCVMEGDIAVEKMIHAKFAELRIRGEWFAPEKQLLDFIKTP